MDSDTFSTNTIYDKLRDEYFSCKWNDAGDYIKFIKFKNLGIECIEINVDQKGLIDRYKIVDEKKWLINKIKYGI